MAGGAFGGNAPLVERSIRELDGLNREAVSRIPELPADGSVHLKAKVTGTPERHLIEIIEYEISPTADPFPLDDLEEDSKEE